MWDFVLAPPVTENDRAIKGSSLGPTMRLDYGPWGGDVLASSAESMMDVVLSDVPWLADSRDSSVACGATLSTGRQGPAERVAPESYRAGRAPGNEPHTFVLSLGPGQRIC